MPRALRSAVPAAALALSACATHAAPPSAPDAEVEARIRRVERGLTTFHAVRGEAPPPLTIEERMRYYRVPGVSIAVINDGRIEWARGWGETEAGSGIPVDTATLFQAASISKPVAAIAALRLVERGRLSLDEDVNARLRSWRVPENAFTATEKVTLRRLLSHSAGTTVHGFPGYAADSVVPTAVQVLDGQRPANTGPVRVDTVPGSRWRYSGGGYTIAQLLMTDVTGRPFAEVMEREVLRPAGMRHSTYAQPLPADRARQAAVAHSGAGRPIAGRYHTYPEQAAAGLWTTPSDLARLAIEVQRAYAGEAGRVITPETARLMLTTQAGAYGLGFGLGGEGDAMVFEHGGSNEGYRAFFSAMARGGRGVVIMTNGENGQLVALEILRAIQAEYGLPGRPSVERDVVALDSATLAAYAGSYTTEPSAQRRFALEARQEGRGLRVTLPAVGWDNRTLLPSAPDTFFFLENAGTVTFTRDASGAVTGATIVAFGQTIPLVRR